ncbi:hypothetical protein WN55_09312 [Dufourea novaeangliae]|uniref:Uncharacterized protein n=1 Tax=Dufourea novaeangliae TaxID=178035 RepID=A0A154PB08_DUFNO|nr:hypothetical protein WN55_09312 [Dufourea novaeangliae]
MDESHSAHPAGAGYRKSRTRHERTLALHCTTNRENEREKENRSRRCTEKRFPFSTYGNEPTFLSSYELYSMSAYAYIIYFLLHPPVYRCRG